MHEGLFAGGKFLFAPIPLFIERIVTGADLFLECCTLIGKRLQRLFLQLGALFVQQGRRLFVQFGALGCERLLAGGKFRRALLLFLLRRFAFGGQVGALPVDRIFPRGKLLFPPCKFLGRRLILRDRLV